MNREIPIWVKNVESALVKAITGFLHLYHPEISTKTLCFLCEPWAHFFTHGILHRYEITTANSLENFPSTDKISPPGDTLAFLEMSRTTSYQLMIDAALAGKPVQYECRKTIETITYPEHTHFASIIAYKSGFNRKFRYTLPWISTGRIRFCNTSESLINHPSDSDLRDVFHEYLKNNLISPNTQLTAWLSAAAKMLFPVSLLEHLGQSWQSHKKSPKIKALFSANAWDIIDEWKIYAAVQKQRNNAILIGSPHALNHGSSAFFWQRDFELKHLDKYLTWGWESAQETHAEIKPFYPPHFPEKIKKLLTNNTKRENEILITSAGRPKHLLEYPYYPENFATYLKNQAQIADLIQKETNSAVIIRTRPNDLGWNLQSIVDAKNNKNIKVEFQKGKFVDRLKRSQLHICDNLSTTIVESLIENHPTLILITNDYFKINSDFESAWTALRQAGILHHESSSLLQKIHIIKNNIPAWWGNKTIQDTIKLFLSIQAKPGGNLLKWKNELLNI